MTHEDDHERVLRHLADLDASDGEALDPNDVARLATGHADEAARKVIHGRMRSEDARIAAAVAAEAGRRAQPTRRSAWRWAAAAAVLLAAGSWWLMADDGTAALGDHDLEVAFHALQEAEPTLFAGIDPVLAAERAGGKQPVTRGGFDVHMPRGTLLENRPTLQWTPLEGADEFELTILSDEGDVVLQHASSEASMPWPAAAKPLPPGAYVLQVRANVAGIDARATQEFRVASDAESARYKTALVMVDEHVAPEVRGIARAHVALRLDLLAEAKRLLDAVDASEARALVDGTRAYLARRGVR